MKMLHINNNASTSNLAKQVAYRFSIPQVSRLFGDPEEEKPAEKDAKKDLECCFLKSFRGLFLFLSHHGASTLQPSSHLGVAWSWEGAACHFELPVALSARRSGLPETPPPL